VKLQELSAKGKRRNNFINVSSDLWEKIKKLEGKKLRWIPVDEPENSEPEKPKKQKKGYERK
jgi:hypothetical protein